MALSLILTGCGSNPLGILAKLGGGGPSVAANVQAGKENTQQVVGNQTETTVGRDQKIETTTVRADKADKVVVNEVSWWVIVLLVLGWLLPSPNEIARWFRSLFNRKKK